ncbi:MAG: hypothetical protein QNJ22_12760 [Desulfosarcinaceae bacterium]|nr:hypothetical protein [Desulfosarcinaceae bacterium]
MRMTLSTLTLWLITAVIMAPLPAKAQEKPQWVFQIATGTAYNFKTPLLIEQDGEDDLKVNAEYKTRAWSTMAPYYNLKIGRWKGDRAWEFESLHHKLFLRNKPDEVQKFQISHGYNLNTINYALRRHGLIYRIGGGIVMTHPETRVRDKENEDDGGLNGFYISGVTGQLALEKRLHFTKALFLSLEGKFTASWARIPIADGHADVPNAALHAIIGAGYAF